MAIVSASFSSKDVNLQPAKNKTNSDWSFSGWIGKKKKKTKKWIDCKVRSGCYCYCLGTLNPQLVPSHSGDVWANLSCGHKSRRRRRLCGRRLWEWSNCPVTACLPVCTVDHTGLRIMFSTRPKCPAESELWALRVCVCVCLGSGVTLLLLKKKSCQCISYPGFTV